MSRRSLLLTALGLGIAADLVLLGAAPLALKTVAALVLAGLLPGSLLVVLLLGRSAAPPGLGEWLLYSVGAGLAVMALVMLAISYLSGGIARWQTLVAFNLLALALLLRLAVAGPERIGGDEWTGRAGAEPGARRWLVGGLLALLLAGAFLRLTGLGYSEFQGDEARAALRAAAVIQGYEDVLLLHKKGPVEILVPATVYSLTGRLTESSARLPFALANLAGLFALFCLGWRLFGPVAGWSAAMLLAVDGYFVGFSRIVQYQSVIFLTSVLVVLILYRLYRLPQAWANYLALAALLLATGLLAHYEAVLVLVPVGFLLWLIWRRGGGLVSVLRASWLPLAAGALVLASFYVPFVLHPNFRATYTYLTDRRLGGTFPYNNLADFFVRTTVYSTTYYLVLMIALAVIGLLLAYRRSLGQRWALPATGVVAGLALVVFAPQWLKIGGTDYTVLLFGLAFLLVWVAPRVPAEERLLWLWFGVAMLVSLFLTAKPRTHVYVFFIPWALISGMVLERGWRRLACRAGRRAAALLGTASALLAFSLFGAYAFWYFVYHDVEILRTWPEHRPRGFWTVYETLDNTALFGFPLQMGWKVVGELYRTGELAGAYETNEKEAWVPDWYTRGAYRCLPEARYYFLIDNLEPEDPVVRQNLENWLSSDWHLYGAVHVNGDPRLRIFERGRDANAGTPPRIFDARTLERSFDAHSAGWDFPLSDPAVEPPIPNQVDYVFGDGIHLAGYAVDRDRVHPGEQVALTLFWRADRFQPEPYTVFIQILDPNVAVYGQRDSQPVCGSRPTNLWDPGQLITDRYVVPVRPDAGVGAFPLIVGMYQAERGERLPVRNGDGTVLGNQVELTTITIEPVQ